MDSRQAMLDLRGGGASIGGVVQRESTWIRV